MSFGSILVLALGLAMDATAAAASTGAAAQRVRHRDALLLAFLFGGFQGGMPVLGWMLGATLGTPFAAWDHWIAFALLSAIGGKMLWSALIAKPKPANPEQRAPQPASALKSARSSPLSLKVLLVLAVATSIDALAAGVTLPMMGAPLVLSVVTIFATTAVLSLAAVYLGNRLARSIGAQLDIVGGLALISIGVKMLVEHTMS